MTHNVHLIGKVSPISIKEPLRDVIGAALYRSEEEVKVINLPVPETCQKVIKSDKRQLLKVILYFYTS